jgi:acyl-CoA thioesterase I
MSQKSLLAITIGSSLLLFSSIASQGGEKSQLVSNLESGKKQTVVAYGTSLTSWGAWVEQLSAELNRRYPGLATVINSGMTGSASKLGVDNLDARVISKQPDTVFIEFSINDAYVPRYTATVAQARANLETMVNRIIATNKSCEIILMVMNPPIQDKLECRPQVESYNQMYRDVAAQRRLRLIDHYPNWQRILKADPKRFSAYIPDGIHPNAEGCKMVITPGIISALGLTVESQVGGDADKPRVSPSK